MSWLLTVAQIGFALIAVFIFVEWRNRKDIDGLVGVACFGLSALFSFLLQSWWPIGIGVVAMVALRQFGFGRS